MSAPAPVNIYQEARLRNYVEWISSGQAARDRAQAFEEECEAYQRRLREPPSRTPAPPPAPAVSGNGWRLLDHPHEPLERLARGLWDLVWHGMPFPPLRVRWARLTGAVGMYVAQERMILVDEGYLAGGGSRRALERTLVHELVHHCHPTEVHGEGFERSLAQAMAFLDLLEEQAAPPVPAFRPAPPPALARAPSGFPRGITVDPRWVLPDGWERR